MKFILLLNLSLLVTAGTLNYPVNEKRQLTALVGQLLGIKLLNPVRINDTAKPILFPKAKRDRVVWGPFKMGASGGQHTNAGGIKLDPNSDTFMAMLKGICQDCMVLNADMQMSDNTGKRLGLSDGIYVHHFISVNVGTKQLNNPVMIKCGDKLLTPVHGFADMSSTRKGNGSAVPKGSGHAHGKRQLGGLGLGLSDFLAAAVFIGKGNEEGGTNTFSAVNSTIKSGFYLAKNDQMILTAEVVNYQKNERDVYVTLDYEYIPNPANGEKPKDYMDVGMGSIGVTGCPGTSANLTPPKDKAIVYSSPEWYFNENGYIVNIHPHLHDGGTYVSVILNDKEVCRQDAIYGDANKGTGKEKWETITGFSGCHNAIKFKKGDKVIMKAEYDLTKHRLRPHAGDDHEMEAEGMAQATFNWALSTEK